MGQKIVIDTNLLLDDANIIYKLSREYKKIVIPLTVLKELDDKKYHANLAYSARNAILAIMQFKEEYPDKILFHVDKKEIDGADALIIESAKKLGAKIATKDVSMSMMAEAMDVESDVYNVVMNNVFDPYVYIWHEDLYKHEDVFSFQQMYTTDDGYYEVMNLFCEVADRNIDLDSWVFIFIQTGEESPIVYANNPKDKILDRIDNNALYLEYKEDSKVILKARDSYQNCAMYALKNAQHVLLTGCWGSGKSLLTTAYALTESKKKTFITRAPKGLNKDYDLGYFPGRKEDKMMDWLAGFMSALYYVYGNTKGQNGRDVDYDYVKDIMFPEKFEILAMNALQGLSLLEQDILMVDEAQLINVDYMSMILSRPSETGRLILLGDLKQTYSVVKPSESGLLKLLRVLPHRSMAYVELQNSYRSDLLEVANQLQDKTIG